MVGRNDSCPCGSGKKYKRCCLGKNEENIETLINEELGRIIQGIYQQVRSRSEMNRYEKYRTEWNNGLRQYWDGEQINVAVTEYFLFIKQQKIWKEYIETVLEGTLRDAVRSIVELWKEPIVLFGKIRSEENGVIQVEEIFGDETYTLKINDNLESIDDIIVFGIALRDNRQFEDGVNTLSSFMFIKDLNQSFENNVKELVKLNKTDSMLAFYQQHMLNVFELMFDRDNTTTEDLIDTKLEDEQQEALSILADVLNDLEIADGKKDFLRDIGVTYFLKAAPRFRKPNVISAAIFNVALDLELLDGLTMTNREIAERFDVSTSSVKTHADRIHEFVAEMLEKQQVTV